MSKRIKEDNKIVNDGWGDELGLFVYGDGDIGFEVCEEGNYSSVMFSPVNLKDALPILEEIVARVKEAKDGE